MRNPRALPARRNNWWHFVVAAAIVVVGGTAFAARVSFWPSSRAVSATTTVEVPSAEEFIDSEPFTVILLPDTQYYAEGSQGAKPEMMYAQMRWIAANAPGLNIKAVVGLGDIVNCGNDVRQWLNADAAYRILDEAAIPYVPT